MAMLVSTLAGAIMHSPAIWDGVTAFATVISKMGGKKAEDLGKKVDKILDKANELPVNQVPVANPAPPPGDPAAPKQSIQDKVAGKVAEQGQKAAEKVAAPVTAVAKEGKEVVAKVEKTADKVADSIGGKLDGMKEKHAEKVAQAEVIEREKLSGQAGALGITVDENKSTAQLKMEVKEAEIAKQKEKSEVYMEWWARNGANGACPKCHAPMRVSLRGNGRVACPNGRCQTNSSSNQVRGQGAPPPPRMFPPAFVLFWNRREAAKQKEAKEAQARAKETPPKDAKPDGAGAAHKDGQPAIDPKSLTPAG